MSLVPYHPREGREIVLRHHNAIVVRDPSSQRLEIRGLQLHECPTCHQPLRPKSPDRHYENTHHGDSYVDPNYFRMLRAGHSTGNASSSQSPPSPIRRLVEPLPAVVHDEHEADVEFVSSSPAPQSGGRIKREAFSPHYFNTFFIEERELGRGGKGVVLLVRHEIDGCNLGHFACKRVPVGDDHAWLEKVLVEVELLANLAHPNLVSYRHVWLEDVRLTRFGPSVACAFILQQYCNGGDLLQYIIGDRPKEATKEELKAQMRRRSKGQAERPKVQKRLAPEEIYSLFKDITAGLSYLHAANYIHRDLKPSNCLLHQDGSQLKCLISDFGEVQPENAVRKSTGSTGTISYCAPEVLKRDASGRYGNFTTKSDVFSLGMILYFMCFGRLPYVNANSVQEELEDVDQLRAEISHWKGFQEERKARPDLPSKLYHLLTRLLAVNPADRPAASEIMGAMGGEYSFDSMMRGSRNTSPLLGLSGQRVQNLDSPMPPSTPVPDPTKHARVNSTTDEDLPSPFSRAAPDASTTQPSTSSLLARRLTPPSTTGSRHPASHTLTLSRNNNNSNTNLSSHNSHNNNNHSNHNNHNPSRPHSPRRRTPSRSPQRTPNLPATSTISPATITTPLLMAPPMTRTTRVRLNAVLAVYRAARWVQAHAMLLRLVIFGLKVLSLSWVCWPYSAQWAVMGAVVVLGAGDLHMGGGEVGSGGGGGGVGGEREGVRSRAGSGGVNGMVSGSGLGLLGPDGGGGGEEGEMEHEEGRCGWPGGWWRSLVLLVVHCVVVGAASRAGVMCAGGWAGRGWEAW
ncbi:kinase-like domain-containing protein [Chaetomium fimeti]|uniref:non-specific serine/threonine protein kinase n=1 Tax=Chaetomium fimeti TaxID=1854472 RepID=A0AAE0HAH5_9PEZI|nr:kinase-like domain-containing protein [Chaetomium fimeti]